MRDLAILSSLRERVADAHAPDRPLFVEVWFACTGKQSPDTKARFAILLDAKAWIDAALLMAHAALPEGRISMAAEGGAISVTIGALAPAGGVSAGVFQTVDRSDGLGWAILAAVLDELLASRPAPKKAGTREHRPE